MKRSIDETHDSTLKSWVESANAEGADFPIQNLPLGAFRHRASREEPRIGVAIGDRILDLKRCGETGRLDGLPDILRKACAAATLNPLAGLGPELSTLLRRRLSLLLRATSETRAAESELLCATQAEMLLPLEVGDYTDFYASIFHATNVGRMFRPDNPLLPNYKYVPIGYHGRSSSIVSSGHALRRPCGQRKPPDAPAPTFGPSERLDYELELGFFIGRGNDLGTPIPIGEAEEHIFGVVLVNDWSARDLQAWEYQPLGPFLAKSFATSVSPWIVTLEALEPFRCPVFSRTEGDPRPLPYLYCEDNEVRGGIDITLEVFLQSASMRERGIEPLRLSRGHFRDMYWTLAQMLTHHSSNGCNLRAGDLMASGTVSGPQTGSRGCLLESTERGTKPLRLPTGEERSFLADGDEVILRGSCEKEGFVRVGFGECRGTVLPASEAE